MLETAKLGSKYGQMWSSIHREEGDLNEQENFIPDESTWPSVGLAYEFVAPSYDWIQRRFDSIDRRIQTLLAFIATLTVGIPTLVLAVQEKVEVISWWFLLAVLFAILAMILGIAAKLILGFAGIKLLTPSSLYNEWLHLSECDFKKDILYWSGQHFGRNASVINWTGWLLTGMTILFALEVIFLLLWATSSLT